MERYVGRILTVSFQCHDTFTIIEIINLLINLA